MEKKSFVAWDYVVFALMLVVSAGIGIFYGCFGSKQATTKEFLMANRSMKMLPVAISILLSFFSAILVLGTPAEMYTEGTEYFMYMFGLVLAIIVSALLFVPLLYPLKLTSSYEYLEQRFNSRAAKLTGTVIMIVQQILYMGIASYAPSTALEAVTGFPVWATIITSGLVSTFYTSLGGMKAVVWSDVFQASVLLAGLLAILISGIINVGGLARVWEINYDWDRIHFFTWDPDPTTRHSIWSLVVGSTVGWASTYGVNQASVQRYCSLPSLKAARQSIFLNIIGVIVFLVVTCLCGIVMFAYFAERGCDPLENGDVANPNQLIPLFVMEVLAYPGMPGLFIACLFSGALSSMSSSLNALAAVTWEDVLKPFLGNLSETKKTLITKLLVLFYGGCGIAFGFMASNLGGTVLQASLSFTGAASGPILGLFCLGAFFPWANWIGAVVGGLLGLAFPLWISVGAYNMGNTPGYLDAPTYNCTVLNVNTTVAPASNGTIDTSPSGIDKLYTVSYLWYPSIGAATVVVVGLVMSFITGPTRMEDVDPKYLIPIFDRLACCLPEAFRRKLRCGYEFQKPKDINADEKDQEIEVEYPSSTELEKPPAYEHLSGLNNRGYIHDTDAYGNTYTELDVSGLPVISTKL